ncbi:hypothetical protein [Paenibacillus sp. A14]|uniref:hypothetical protein n=1 Tax=Paenibacillus sp. A14 TaxID=3119820 RepID=UPI002FE35867
MVKIPANLQAFISRRAKKSKFLQICKLFEQDSAHCPDKFEIPALLHLFKPGRIGPAKIAADLHLLKPIRSTPGTTQHN